MLLLLACGLAAAQQTAAGWDRMAAEAELQGRFKDAEIAYRNSLRAASVPSEHIIATANLVQFLSRTGLHGEALRLASKLELTLRESTLPPAQKVNALSCVAAAYSQSARAKDAVPILESAIRLATEADLPAPVVFNLRNNLAMGLLGLGRPQVAEPLLAMLLQLDAPDYERRTLLLVNHAQALSALNRHVEAVSEMARAIALVDALEISPDLRLRAHTIAAAVFRRAGDSRSARSEEKCVKEIARKIQAANGARHQVDILDLQSRR